MALKHQQTPNTLTADKYQRSNEHGQFSFSHSELNHLQKTSYGSPIHLSIAQSDYLPNNLVVTFDNSHNPTGGQTTASNLEGNLTVAGSAFNTMGVFSIPADTNVLLIPCSNSTYTTDELNSIYTWFTSDGARLLWVAGESDYAGYFNNTPSNDILVKVGANLRIAADTVDDKVNNDNASYRVAAQTPLSDGELNSIITTDVSSAIFHGPTSVLGYQSGSVVDLNQTSINGVEIIMKTSINATALDEDLTGTELDYYSSHNLNGSYPMMAIQNMGNRKSVIVSGEVIFSNYQHMYDLYTAQGKKNNPYAWNGGYHDGKTLVDNVLAWFGREVGANLPISINGDSEFRGFPGNGTLINPYRIEGYNITASSGPLISVSGTTVHFSIKKNRLNGMSTAWEGVSIQNVVNGTIANNTISNCQNIGIDIYGSNYNIFIGNKVNNTHAGIILWEFTTNNTIVENTVLDMDAEGIGLHSADNNTVRENIVYNNGAGIALFESATQTRIIDNNVFDNNAEGIGLHAADNNTITGNTIHGNDLGIVFFKPSDGNILTKNNIHNNKLGIEIRGQWNYMDNNIVHDNKNGIYLENSINNYLRSNIIFENEIYGIILWESQNNNLEDNYLTNNGIYLGGESFDSHLQASVINNSVNGKPFVYWKDVQGGTVPSDAGQIYLFNCDSVTITNHDLSNNSIGIAAAFSSNILIQDNIIHDCRWGIMLDKSTQESLVTNNTMYNNYGDIQLWLSTNNIVSFNYLGDNSNYSVAFDAADCNLISNNTISGTNESGIMFWGGNENMIEHNLFQDNVKYALVIEGSSNIVQFNDFLDNNLGGVQATDNGTNNIIKYNYWNDWTSPDNDNDGFVDFSYSIDGTAYNNDILPLASPNPTDTCLLFFPTLGILFPNGGEIVNGIITIQWSWPVDSYGHQVTFIIYYSDGGSWTFLSSGLTTTFYSWDTTNVPDGSSYRIRVVVVCEANQTTEDISDVTFTIQNDVPISTSAPPTTIVTPTTTTSSTTTSVPSSSDGQRSIPASGMTGIVTVVSLLPILILRKMKRKPKDLE